MNLRLGYFLNEEFLKVLDNRMGKGDVRKKRTSELLNRVGMSHRTFVESLPKLIE